MSRYEIILSGYGGQGVVLGGIILAEAAAIYDNKNAIHNQSYGPEARGGACESIVIISSHNIHFPEIEQPNILVALTQQAADKLAPKMHQDGILIIDSSITVTSVPETVKVIKLPLIESTLAVFGRGLVLNIVTLGALVTLVDAASKEALEKAVLSRVPKGTEEMNLKAMAIGFKLGEDFIAANDFAEKKVM